MIQALHNGASGMIAQQKNVDVIANNIANINTTGYIKNRVDFKDAVYSAMINPANENSTENLKQGNGVLISGTSKVYSPAIYVETENPLDFSINGSGFFAVQNEDGLQSYTRNGSFKISETNGEQFLATENGQYVLDENMQKIPLKGNPYKMVVNREGYITFENEEEPSAKIGIVNFTDSSGLESIGNNMLMATAASGQPCLCPGL
jgi:flagellar basal-body rod protein FlgG